MRLIVGMTGATGAVFGIRLLEHLRELPEVETHPVLSRWARTTIELETGRSVREVADVMHSPEDQGTAISSGSFRTDGMIIAPCSMKTLAAIRVGYADGLVAPAAVGDIVDHIAARILDQFDLPAPAARRWEGMHAAHRTNPRNTPTAA